MKHLKYIWTLVLAVVVMSSCSDDTDNPYDHQSTISVESQNLDFSAHASTDGLITVKAENGISKVTTDMPWCKATADGNQVKVSVDINESLESRYAKVTIWSGTDSVNVVASQAGAGIRLGNSYVLLTDKGGKTNVKLTDNGSQTLTTTAKWFTATLQNDSTISITAQPNETGARREGWVKVQSGDFADSVQVIQQDFDKDIAGIYVLEAKDSVKAAGYKTYLTEITEKTLNFYFGNTEPIRINWTYDIVNNIFTFTSAQSMGILDVLGQYQFYCFNVFVAANGQISGYSTDYTMALVPSAEEGIDWEFSGMMDNSPIIAMAINITQAEEFNKNTNLGAFAAFYDAMFTKYDPNEDQAKKFTDVASAKRLRYLLR